MIRWAIAGLLAVAASAAPAAAQNWNAEYEQTAQGHRIGNPEAEIQLIEFVSYTCPHCATFERDSEAELKYFYVHEGMANVEVRHLIRNIVDVTAAMIAECGPDENFFANHRALLVNQPTWLARAQSLTPAQQQRWNAGDVPARLRAVADDLEFYELMEGAGYSRTQLDQCLNDPARADSLVAMSQANSAEYNVPGTPSFVLNGSLLEGVHSWPQLGEVLMSLRAPPEADIFD